MQTPLTNRDLEKHAIVGLVLAGLTCWALAAIGTAHEQAESQDIFVPVRVDHIARSLKYAPSAQFDRAASLVASASAPAGQVMRAAGVGGE